MTKERNALKSGIFILVTIGACIAIRGCRLMRTDSSPSEISSSEMPDSSSNSINFLTLRISIRYPLQDSLGLSGGQARAGSFERELIPVCAKTYDAADCDAG